MLNIATIILAILYIIGCGMLITVILLQKKRSAGLGSGIAGMGGGTYWDKNKGRSFEGSLEKYSKIGGALLFIITAATWFIK